MVRVARVWTLGVAAGWFGRPGISGKLPGYAAGMAAGEVEAGGGGPAAVCSGGGGGVLPLAAAAVCSGGERRMLAGG